MAILVALPLGAALLALWLVVRHPGLLPDSLRLALLHFALSLGIELVPGAVARLAAEGRLAAALAFVVVLWALVYAWLAVAAVLRTLHNAIAE
jgi:uncharacterized transporter YbjL